MADYFEYLREVFICVMEDIGKFLFKAFISPWTDVGRNFDLSAKIRGGRLVPLSAGYCTCIRS